MHCELVNIHPQVVENYFVKLFFRMSKINVRPARVLEAFVSHGRRSRLQQKHFSSSQQHENFSSSHTGHIC